MAVITLTWNPPTAGNGGPVANYEVFRLQSNDSTPTESTIIDDGLSPITTIPVDLSKETSNGEYEYQDSSLNSQGGTSDYYWTVRATNNGGSSAGANPVKQTL